MDSSPSDKTDVVRKKPKKVVQRESDNVHRCLQQQAAALPLEPIVRSEQLTDVIYSHSNYSIYTVIYCYLKVYCSYEYNVLSVSAYQFM